MKLTFNKVVPEPIPRPLIASSKIWEEEITWAPNDRILVQAQSGKGKSTLLHLIYGLRKDYSGSWEIDSVQSNDIVKALTYKLCFNKQNKKKQTFVSFYT